MTRPLVSCIMLTTGNRPEFEEQARFCFESQTYPNKELIVVPGPDTIGKKRNIGCDLAQGEIIVHWDNDDLYSPNRISDQVTRLINADVELTGYHSMVFFDDLGSWWRYSGTHKYILGVSMCYWKTLWEVHPFNPKLNVCEDNEFQKGVKSFSADSRLLILARIHGGNTSKKLTMKPRWSKVVGTELIDKLNILRRSYSEGNGFSRSKR